MEKRWPFLSLALLIGLLFAARATAFDKVRIVFYHVQGSEGIATTIEENFKRVIAESLAVSPIVEPVSINDIYVLFDSLRIPPESCTKTECAIKIGKATSASKSMYVQLRKDANEQVMLSAILFDIASSAIEYTSSPFFLILQDPMSVSLAINQLIGVIESRIPIVPEIVQVDPDGANAVIDCGSLQGIRKDIWYEIFKKEKRGVKYDEIKVGEARIDNVTRENARVHIRRVQGLRIRPGCFLKIIKGEDHKAPEMLHEPFNICAANMPLNVSVDLSDVSGIGWATVSYKSNMDTAYKKISMNPDQGNRYVAYLPPEDIRGGELAYFFESSDLLNNTGVYRALGGALDFTAQIKSDDHEIPTLEYTPIQLLNRGMKWNVYVQAVDNTMVDAVRLFYRFKGDESWKHKKLIQYGPKGYGLEIEIPDTLSESILDYYMTATDIAGNSASLASEARPLSILVGTNDTEKPQLVFDKIEWSESDQTFWVTAEARDNSKVKSVYLTYYYSGRRVKDVELEYAEGETYQKKIDIPDKNMKSLQYTLRIADLMNNTYESPVKTSVIPGKIGLIAADHTKPYTLLPPNPANFCFLPDSNKVKEALIKKHIMATYYLTFLLKDNVDITHVNLYYRSIGDYDYSVVPVFVWGDILYGTFISATVWGVEYFAEAYDPNGNILKIASASAPLRVFKPQPTLASSSFQNVINKIEENH